MTTDTYHHGALHQAILDAALAEARQRGPQAISVRGLTKVVGVTPSAIYRHVPSLDVLVAEVSQAAREHIAEHMAKQRDQVPGEPDDYPELLPDDPMQRHAAMRLRALGRAYIECALAQPHLFDTASAPTSASPPRPDNPSAWELLVGSMQELVDSGALHEDAKTDAALIAWSATHGIASILRWAQEAKPVTGNHQIEVVLDSVWRAIETM